MYVSPLLVTTTPTRLPDFSPSQRVLYGVSFACLFPCCDSTRGCFTCEPAVSSQQRRRQQQQRQRRRSETALPPVAPADVAPNHAHINNTERRKPQTRVASRQLEYQR